MPKPNTMDDWIDRILEDLEAECTYSDSNAWVTEKSKDEAKALITAKLEEVARAARIDELEKQLYSNWGNRKIPENAIPTIVSTQRVKDRLVELRKDSNATKD